MLCTEGEPACKCSPPYPILRHTPRRRGIQYAAPFEIRPKRRGILDRPPSRTMTSQWPSGPVKPYHLLPSNLLTAFDARAETYISLTSKSRRSPRLLARGAGGVSAAAGIDAFVATRLGVCGCRAARSAAVGVDARIRGRS